MYVQNNDLKDLGKVSRIIITLEFEYELNMINAHDSLIPLRITAILLKIYKKEHVKLI